MPKENRLRLQKDFQRVFKSGRRLNTATLSWVVAQNEAKLMRFGVVISKKNEKLAVNRNLVRRRMKEILRAVLPTITPSSLDVVILCSPKTASLSFGALQAEVEEGIRLLDVTKS